MIDDCDLSWRRRMDERKKFPKSKPNAKNLFTGSRLFFRNIYCLCLDPPSYRYELKNVLWIHRADMSYSLFLPIGKKIESRDKNTD